MQDLLIAHLNRHDGGCKRTGKEINRLAARAGCSLELLRSVYYRRRNIRDAGVISALKRAIRTKK